MTDSDTDEELEGMREQKVEHLRAEGEDLDEPVHVEGEDSLESILENHPLVLLDFHADWCGPCEMIAPIVDELAAETPATVAKIDVDANQGLAKDYGVRSIPALMLVEDGEVVEQMTGVQEEDHLRSLIEQYT